MLRNITCNRNVRTVIQPCNKPQNFGLSTPGGAYRLAHLYCAPTVGLMLANSPKDAAIAVDPSQAIMVP
jgi:hypothetical protein